MCPFHGPDDQVALLQLNSELEQAQLELLSAHCATHQLRLHYSTDELARFGRRDVLRKSAEAASALNNFYADVEKKIARSEQGPPPFQPTDEHVARAVEWLATHLRDQRAHYRPAAGELSPRDKACMWPYFPPALLDQIRIVELNGARVEAPPFFAEVRALGFEPPDITHMDSLTFLDVVVFNQQLTERALFHALVHAVQIQSLGLDRYAQLWIRSFVKSRTHFTVPLEVHAFSLASRFRRPSAERFSVEESVVRWIKDDRY